MATKFRGVEGVPVEQAQQDLSLQTDGSMGLTEVAGTVKGVLDEGRIANVRETVMETVDEFETDALTQMADFNSEKPLDDKQIAQLIGTEESTLTSAPAAVKQMSHTLATAVRAANQNKIDPSALEIRLEAIARQAMRRYPGLAREFSTVLSLYGGSSLIQEIDALNRARASQGQSAEQEQLEKFVNEAVDAGMNRADYLADPGKFLTEAYNRVNEQTKREDIIKQNELAISNNTVSKIGDKKAVNAYSGLVAGESSKLWNKFKGRFASVSDMRAELASGSPNAKQFRAEVAAFKSEALIDAGNRFPTLSPSEVQGYLAPSFALMDALMDETSTDAMHEASQKAFDAVQQMTFDGLPPSTQEMIHLFGIANDSGMTRVVGFDQIAEVREAASDTMKGLLSGMQTDGNDPASLRRLEEEADRRGREQADLHANGSAQTRSAIETATLAVPKSLTKFAVSQGEERELAAKTLYYATTQFVTTLDYIQSEGNMLPRKYVNQVIKAIADPEFPVAMDELGWPESDKWLESNETLGKLVLTHAGELRENLKKVLPTSIEGTPAPALAGVRVSNTRPAPKLGEGLMVYYNPKTNSIRLGDLQGNEYSANSSGAIEALNSIRSTIMARAHLNGGNRPEDYRRGLLFIQRYEGIGNFLKIEE